MRNPFVKFTARNPGFFFTPAVQGFFFAFLATVIWSFNFIAGRGLADAMPPCTLACIRWLIAFFAATPLALPALRGEWREFVRHWRYYIFISAVGVAYSNAAIYSAAHTTTALNMSLIATSSPLFTIMLARIFFVEAIPPARLAGIAAAFCGIALLISGGSASVLASLSFHSGDLLMLSSSLSFSVYTLLARKLPGGVRPLSHLAVTSGLGALLLAPFSLWELARGGTAHFSAALVGGLLYMGIGASLAAFWCWFRAIARIGPTKASIVYYSLPLFSGLEAVFFLGEPVFWTHFAGGILILGGLALATRNAKK